MKYVYIYAEGQTEETFANLVLKPALEPRGIHPVPVLAQTKRTASGNTYKGGVLSWAQVERDLRRLLGNTNAALVTTLLDFYGLPPTFPGMSDCPPGAAPIAQVQHIERAMAHAINHARFLPFLVLHEFEALLFADPARILQAFPDAPSGANFIQEVSGVPPEDINGGRDTHPAARIERHFPTYRKRLHGPQIAADIGLSAIRARCPHFDEWVTTLLALDP